VSALLVAPALLNKRWHVMRPHAKQRAFYLSEARFNVVPAGRRSGKTEIAKRRLVRRAVRGTQYDRPRYFYGAPTYGQAKKIAWEDLKRMVPRDAMRGSGRTPWSESELTIPLWHGGELVVLGLDQPQRVEGAPWDGGCLDEYGNMKPTVWTLNVRPALSDREGWCDLIGVPEGRNHYYEIDLEAQAKQRAGDPEWNRHHWVSADILPAKEIAAARSQMDALSFQQEYEASFVNFAGRAYYAFTDDNKLAARKLYSPRQPLIFAFDFNVAPGVAVVLQELRVGAEVVTCVIGEVWIENNSNTPAVCRKLLTDWGAHEGRVEVFGDATGGARGTAKVAGSDWDIAKKALRDGDASASLKGFGDRVNFYVKSANPAERARVNAMNSRTCTMDGTRRLFVDDAHAPHVVKDLEGVTTLKGGSGEIDKKANPMLTHISDALGYYIDHRFPVVQPGVGFSSLSI